MRTRSVGPLQATAQQGGAPSLVRREVCALSGAVPGPACHERTHELFLAGSEPHHECTFHERVAVVPQSGLRAGPACPSAVPRDFERYPEPFGAWAARANRPRAPEAYDPACPGPSEATRGAPRIVYPFDGAHFTLDEALSAAQQRLVFRSSRSSGDVRFVLDGRPLAASDRGEHDWPLQRGRHALRAESSDGRGPTIHFSVD